MGVLSRSLAVTRVSFGVILRDRELLLFPILSAICSVSFVVAMLYPTLIIEGAVQRQSELEPVAYLMMFATYFGLSFITTFFNVCVVSTARTRFGGGDATFGESLGVALRRLPQIFAWSVVSASVGVLLAGLERSTRSSGPLARALAAVTRAIVGTAWTIATLFVVPAMVYEGVGPFGAIGRSVDALRKTWGESLVRHYGLGWAFSLLLMLGLGGFAIAAFVLTPAGGETLFVTIAGFAGLYVVLLFLLFTLANAVFNTALYHYARTGQVPGRFDEDVLKEALVKDS